MNSKTRIILLWIIIGLIYVGGLLWIAAMICLVMDDVARII